MIACLQSENQKLKNIKTNLRSLCEDRDKHNKQLQQIIIELKAEIYDINNQEDIYGAGAAAFPRD